MYSNIAVTNKHTAKLHHVGSFYIYYVMMHGKPNIKKFDCSIAADFEHFQF